MTFSDTLTFCFLLFIIYYSLVSHNYETKNKGLTFHPRFQQCFVKYILHCKLIDRKCGTFSQYLHFWRCACMYTCVYTGPITSKNIRFCTKKKKSKVEQAHRPEVMMLNSEHFVIGSWTKYSLRLFWDHSWVYHVSILKKHPNLGSNNKKTADLKTNPFLQNFY